MHFFKENETFFSIYEIKKSKFIKISRKKMWFGVKYNCRKRLSVIKYNQTLRKYKINFTHILVKLLKKTYICAQWTSVNVW